MYDELQCKQFFLGPSLGWQPGTRVHRPCARVAQDLPQPAAGQGEDMLLLVRGAGHQAAAAERGAAAAAAGPHNAHQEVHGSRHGHGDDHKEVGS